MAAWFATAQMGITPDGFFSRRPSAEGIVLCPGSTVLCLGHEYVRHLFSRFPEAERLAHMVQEAYHRESEAEKRILRGLSAREKYAYLIKHRPQVLDYAPSRDIASYLGISRKTYQRARKNFRN